MSNSAATQTKWIALGKTYNPDISINDGVSGPEPINIKEEPFSVKMNEGDEPYGQPIDANLAIHLIQRLLEKLEASGFLSYSELSSNKGANNKLPVTGCEDLLKWFKDLLIFSMGITFDKNILLKLISQPKCEGVRYYLCLKQSNIDKEPKDVLSLVLVGVDSEGCDLHYEISKSAVDVFAVSTESLTAEYGHPPGTGIAFKDLTDPRYVLLNLAIKKTQAK